jgi:S1-C subfamily serine protease
MDGLQNLSDELAAAVERASVALVGVNGRPRFGSTGVHWRPGLVVTADHTVQADAEVTVTRSDGQVIAATVAGRDPTIDIAVLKVEAADGPVADVGDSETVRLGHIVLALGRGPRASWGIVSAIGEHRRLNLDLTLYPGFSGGPLVDVQGKVVGVTTSGASRHLQLAIPASAVNRVVDEFVRRGRIPRAYLGVGTQLVRLPEALRQRLDLDQRTAVIVVDVQPSSPAASAGVLIGDVVLSLGGARITDPADLRAALRPDRVGETITASVLRGGEPRDVHVNVGERPRRAH